MDTLSQTYKLLSLIAMSGECCKDVYPFLSITDSYREKLITKLKSDGLIKIHYKDKLRGIRLTRRGKDLLLSISPNRFSYYLTGNSETNRPRSDTPRRLRLQQGSITYAMLIRTGIPVYPDEKPALFSGNPIVSDKITLPLFYGAREWKDLRSETIKINNSRSLGILLCEDALYVLYFTGDHPIKWEYRTELRLKAFLNYHLQHDIFPGLFHKSMEDYPIRALFLGTPMESARKLMESNGGFQKSYFYLDGSFDYMHFVPVSMDGIAMLKLLSNHTLQSILYSLLLSDLAPVNPDLSLVHDAVKGTIPVLLSYDFDMLRISRFKTALSFHGITGHLICFDFQKEVLQSYFGNLATIETIDLTKFERRFLH
jgi:hypothetical protein